MQDPAASLSAETDRLLACIHCGFCLDACPTYRRGGNESDSPRGRLYLMRAVGEGRIAPDADAFRLHLDRCLGCRACEPVCPSGVEYGFLLERGREAIANARGISTLERMLLATFGSPILNAIAGFFARLARGTRLAALATRVTPRRMRRLRLAAAMLESSRPWNGTVPIRPGDRPGLPVTPPAQPVPTTRVAIFHGCVQKTLFRRVNTATATVMRHNGCALVEVSGQRCCGALHAHAGALDGARELARRNLHAFEPFVSGPDAVDAIIVNAAGCGAMMKEYGTLFEGQPERELAEAVATRVHDPLVYLGRRGIRPGAPVEARVAWDSPCHLLHGQRSGSAPLDTLRAAIPGLDVVPVPRAEECCGGAGIHELVHGGYYGSILSDKLAAVRSVEPDIVVSGNPGCMMQIGGGLFLEGEGVRVVHPVELIALSYS